MFIIATVAFVASILSCLGLTRLLISWAPRLGLIDEPGERRIHKTAVPRAGGIAVWTTVISIVAVCLSSMNEAGRLDWAWFKGFAIGSSILVVVGIVDDKRGLSAWFKLSVHIFVAVLLFFLRGGLVGNFLGFEIPWFVDLILWVSWTVVLINAFNLIDGMDGLCAGLASISIFFLTVLSFFLGRFSDGVILLVVLGALLGFLRYNVNPARIFLGDAGSMFIGFTIASVATVSTGERFTAATLLLPIAVAGVPLIDLVLAVWRRSLKSWIGKARSDGRADDETKVFAPDQHHLHHRLLSYGLSQRRVAMILYGLAVLGSVVVILPSILDERVIGLTFAAMMVIALVGIRYLAPVELKISETALDVAIKRPAKNRVNRFALTLLDLAALSVSLVIAWVLEFSGSISILLDDVVSSLMLFAIGCGIFVLNTGKAHARRWGRASVRDFMALVVWLSVGFLIAATVSIFVREDFFEAVRVHFLAFGFAVGFCSLPRIMTPVIRETSIDSRHRKRSSRKSKRKRVLLYGAGDLGELFLSHLKITGKDDFDDFSILGFLDDRSELRGKYFDGFKIRGTLENLPHLIEELNLKAIILTVVKISPQKLSEISDVCEASGIRVHVWNPELKISEINPKNRHKSVDSYPVPE